MEEERVLERITVNPGNFGSKPIIRGRRLAVEHILGMLAAGDSPETILEGYPWLETDDFKACLVYSHRLVSHKKIEPFLMDTGTWDSFWIRASGVVPAMERVRCQVFKFRNDERVARITNGSNLIT